MLGAEILENRKGGSGTSCKEVLRFQGHREWQAMQLKAGHPGVHWLWTTVRLHTLCKPCSWKQATQVCTGCERLHTLRNPCSWKPATLVCTGCELLLGFILCATHAVESRPPRCALAVNYCKASYFACIAATRWQVVSSCMDSGSVLQQLQWDSSSWWCSSTVVVAVSADWHMMRTRMMMIMMSLDA